jgi:oligopeptide transport system substrate-binding protein
MQVEAGVAKEWTLSEDRRCYTFKIDPDARWSNGDSVTAEDFIFSFERILNPALGAPYAYMLYPMAGAEDYNKGITKDFKTVGVHAPNSSTLVLTW